MYSIFNDTTNSSINTSYLSTRQSLTRTRAQSFFRAMKLVSILGLLCSTASVVSGSQLTPRAPKCPKPEGTTDAQIIAAYKSSGQCFSYTGAGNREKSIAPCAGADGYCQKVKGVENAAAGCELFVPEGVKLDKSLANKDEDCNEWYAGQCTCECDFCEEIADIVIEGLEQLDSVICAVMLSSLTSIADAGLTFIPGGQAPKTIKAIVQGAKSFYENGAEAASFFGSWIGPACGIPDFNFDITMVFGSLLGAPDSMSRGKPVGCKKKNKNGCRDVKPVPDPTTKPDQPTVKPTDKPQPTTTPKPATTPKPETTSAHTTSSPASSTTEAGAGCAYCGEFVKTKAARDEKYQLMYARAGNSADAPACVLPPADGSMSKRSLFGFLPDQLSSRSLLLQGRGLAEKDTKFDGFLLGGTYEVTLSMGKYMQGADAEKIPEISKFWAYKDPQNTNQCSVEVVKDANKANGKKYDTEHVFEAQTVMRFLSWLSSDSGGKLGTTYKMPSAAWVVDTFLSSEDSKTEFLIVSPGKTNVGDLFTPSSGERGGALIAYGFGRSDGVKSISGGQNVERIPATRGNKNLALLEKEINMAKGKWFGMNRVASDYSKMNTQSIFRTEMRRGVAPFLFLGASDGQTDTIWKKWARVANWIDLVMYTFDQQYKWGTRAGEPKNSKGDPSMRSLWAYWIDKELGDIEALAAAWATQSATVFDQKFPKNKRSAAEEKWRNDAFGTNGFATAAKLKFPRPAGLPAGASIYGAYGWKDVT
ncbi:hypothetical protein K4K49_000750 [Colletotrichum sp. SAR 10_70]|nr:hypothetical protein K4K50_003204 [Colletotrichum sp. SAR 10_71]KAI8183495.1 hypothetical protein K4K49_000750 [Colletotrichum sp. SAR 10_70]